MEAMMLYTESDLQSTRMKASDETIKEYTKSHNDALEELAVSFEREGLDHVADRIRKKMWDEDWEEDDCPEIAQERASARYWKRMAAEAK